MGIKNTNNVGLNGKQFAIGETSIVMVTVRDWRNKYRDGYSPRLEEQVSWWLQSAIGGTNIVMVTVRDWRSKYRDGYSPRLEEQVLWWLQSAIGGTSIVMVTVRDWRNKYCDGCLSMTTSTSDQRIFGDLESSWATISPYRRIDYWGEAYTS